MTDYWDEPTYADVDREARAHWLAERPDPAHNFDDDPHHWPPIDAATWRRLNGIPEPVDPWAHQQIDCERCDELREPSCTHSRALCAECATFCCQSCATEDADAAAIQQQRHDEWWGRA